jgi:Flp pilus assembly protein TadD
MDARDEQWLVRAYELLAEIHRQRNDSRLSLQARRAVVELSPEEPAARVGLALELFRLGQRESAIRELGEAQRTASNDADAWLGVGKAYMQIGELNLGTQCFQRAVHEAPHEVEPRLNLAIAQQYRGKGREAVKHYEQIVIDHPEAHEAVNNLAWLLATSSNQEIRDVDRALSLAQGLCQQTDYQQASYLDTLAAAQAAHGNFAAAVQTLSTAIPLAQERQQVDLADRLRRRLELYSANRPYVE